MNNDEGNFVVGMYWGLLLSLPLWVSLLGWVRLIWKLVI
jgi:hypothetical protein